MRHLVLTTMLGLGTLIAYGTNNDSGADGKNDSKDYFYYCGDEKIPLRYDATKVVVFDFNEDTDIDASRKTIRRQCPGLAYIRHFETTPIKDKNSILVTIYDVTDADGYEIDYKSRVKVMPCYIYQDHMEVAPDGYINVTLKEAEDFEILMQLADNFNLEFLKFNIYEPLWCILRITHKTQLSPIEIANTLQETGLFKYASPSFSFDGREISYDPDVLKQWGLYNQYFENMDTSVSEAWGYYTLHTETISSYVLPEATYSQQYPEIKQSLWTAHRWQLRMLPGSRP